MSVSEKQKEYAKRYLSKLSEIRIRMKPEEKDDITAAAAMAGKSVNRYILDAVSVQIERDRH